MSDPTSTNGKPATCRRCKELKARCDRTHQLPCSRCVRLQIPCEAGPPSRQGKLQRPAGDSGSADPEMHIINDLVNLGRKQSMVCRRDWDLLVAHIRGACAHEAPLSHKVIACAIRQACMFATPGENPSLLGMIASAAAWLGVPEAIQAGEIRERAETPPVPVISYLQSRPSPSYALARCFTTRHGVCGTDAFYRDVCPLGRMIEWLECNRGGSITSLFIDADDTLLIPEAGGRLMAQAATISHPRTSICARVHMSTAAAPGGSVRGTPCLLNIVLLTNHHFGAADTWFGVELIPLPDMADCATRESSAAQTIGSAATRSAAAAAEQRLGHERVDESHDERYDESVGAIATVHELMDAFESICGASR